MVKIDYKTMQLKITKQVTEKNYRQNTFNCRLNVFKCRLNEFCEFFYKNSLSVYKYLKEPPYL